MRPINFNRLSDRTHQTGWLVGEQGYTALHLAAKFNYPRLVHYLLEPRWSGLGGASTAVLVMLGGVAAFAMMLFEFRVVQLASGLRGIAERIEPTRPTEGDAYALENRRPLPATLREAMEAAQGSTFLAETLGEPLVGLLIDNAARELDVVEREVPPSELARYLEAM